MKEGKPVKKGNESDGLILDLGDAKLTDYSAMGLSKDSSATRKLNKLTLVSGFSLPLGLVAGFYGYTSGGVARALVGLAAGVICGTIFGLLAHGLTESAGDFMGRFIFLGSRPSWTIREKQSADIQRVRFSIGNRRYGEALSIADQVLKKDPSNPEALYLKARVLWDGFESPAPARECLRKLLAQTPPDDPHHKWAEQFYRDISAAR